MTETEAIQYLQKLVKSERQCLVEPKVKTTPYIEALELAIERLGEVERATAP